MSKKRVFKCALCKNEYKKPPEDKKPPEEEWSEEMRQEEFKKLYPGESVSQEDIALVCDDCHEMIVEWRKTNMPGGMLQ